MPVPSVMTGKGIPDSVPMLPPKATLSFWVLELTLTADLALKDAPCLICTELVTSIRFTFSAAARPSFFVASLPDAARERADVLA